MPRSVPMKAWTQEEDDALVAMVDLPIAEQTRRLGRTATTVNDRRKLLRAQGRIAPQRVFRPWTTEEVGILMEMFDQPVEEIARRLGRTGDAIQNKRGQLRERLRDMPTGQE